MYIDLLCIYIKSKSLDDNYQYDQTFGVSLSEMTEMTKLNRLKDYILCRTIFARIFKE